MHVMPGPPTAQLPVQLLAPPPKLSPTKVEASPEILKLTEFPELTLVGMTLRETLSLLQTTGLGVGEGLGEGEGLGLGLGDGDGDGEGEGDGEGLGDDDGAGHGWF